MIRILFTFVISLLYICCCFGQSIVNGKLLNRDTKEPIPYVNIGIPGSGIGSISNQDGSFSIVIPLRHTQDSLTFSAIGYGSKKVAIGDFSVSNDTIVFLNEKVTLLKEVLIEGSREKRKIYEIGNRSFNGGVLEPDTIYAGRSIALLIDKTKQENLQFPLYIEKASLRILRNNLPSFKFRVRLNAVDAKKWRAGN